MPKNHTLEYLPKRALQNCPLCGEPQTVMMRGLCHDLETNELKETCDRGYSFCNCRNIFFTDWKNIKLELYDYNYKAMVSGDDDDKKSRLVEIEHQWNFVSKFCRHAESFINIGDYDDLMIDYVKNNFWKKIDCTALDIIKRESKHPLIIGNFEELDIKEKYDVIWMSHFFEHVKDPIVSIRKARDMLTDDGILFIAMPDTNHIDWNDPMGWLMWVVSEHHVLWNVHDFVAFAEENGLKCLHKEISTDVIKKTYANNKETFLWIKESRSIFRKSQ